LASLCHKADEGQDGTGKVLDEALEWMIENIRNNGIYMIILPLQACLSPMKFFSFVKTVFILNSE
jgi:hypothetical protein